MWRTSSCTRKSLSYARLSIQVAPPGTHPLRHLCAAPPLLPPPLRCYPPLLRVLHQCVRLPCSPPIADPPCSMPILTPHADPPLCRHSCADATSSYLASQITLTDDQPGPSYLPSMMSQPAAPQPISAVHSHCGPAVKYEFSPAHNPDMPEGR